MKVGDLIVVTVLKDEVPYILDAKQYHEFIDGITSAVDNVQDSTVEFYGAPDPYSDVDDDDNVYVVVTGKRSATVTDVEEWERECRKKGSYAGKIKLLSEWEGVWKILEDNPEFLQYRDGNVHSLPDDINDVQFLVKFLNDNVGAIETITDRVIKLARRRYSWAIEALKYLP